MHHACIMHSPSTRPASRNISDMLTFNYFLLHYLLYEQSKLLVLPHFPSYVKIHTLNFNHQTYNLASCNRASYNKPLKNILLKTFLTLFLIAHQNHSLLQKVQKMDISTTPTTPFTYEFIKKALAYTGVLVGQGSGGVVTAITIHGIEYALKQSEDEYLIYELLHEAEMYKTLQCHHNNLVGLPRIFNQPSLDAPYLLMTKYHSNLADLSDQNPDGFHPQTIYLIWIELLHILQYIHSKGIIHGDIKPGNIVMDRRGQHDYPHIIDFGNSEYYIHPKTGLHVPNNDTDLRCTAPYASDAHLQGTTQSRRDDLESLFYAMLNLLFGVSNSLWVFQSFPDAVLEHRAVEITEDSVAAFSVHLWAYYQYVKNLTYEEEPDYEYLATFIRHALRDQLQFPRPVEEGEEEGEEAEEYPSPIPEEVCPHPILEEEEEPEEEEEEYPSPIPGEE